MKMFVLTDNLAGLTAELAAHGGDYHFAELVPGALWVAAIEPRFAAADDYLKGLGHFPLPHLLDSSPIDPAILAKLPAQLVAAIGALPSDTALTLARKLHQFCKFAGVRPRLY